jgi:hypothetical protein
MTSGGHANAGISAKSLLWFMPSSKINQRRFLKCVYRNGFRKLWIHQTRWPQFIHCDLTLKEFLGCFECRNPIKIQQATEVEQWIRNPPMRSGDTARPLSELFGEFSR